MVIRLSIKWMPASYIQTSIFQVLGEGKLLNIYAMLNSGTSEFITRNISIARWGMGKNPIHDTYYRKKDEDEITFIHRYLNNYVSILTKSANSVIDYRYLPNYMQMLIDYFMENNITTIQKEILKYTSYADSDFSQYNKIFEEEINF